MKPTTHLALQDLRTYLANVRAPTPAMVALRSPTSYEVLTGHLRLAVAQEAGERSPAVVMGTGETVWIEPDGTVTHAQPDRRQVREPRRRPAASH